MTILKTRLLALCLGTLVVFFVSSMACFADEVGAIPCFQSEFSECSDQEHDHASQPEADCDGCLCNQNTLLLKNVTSVVIMMPAEFPFLLPFGLLPEEPVYDIEYPPQLS